MLSLWSKSSTTISINNPTTTIAPGTMDVTTPTNERPGALLEQAGQEELMPDLPVPSLVASASEESSPELPPIVSPSLEDQAFNLNAAPRMPECWGHRGASANFRE